MRDRARLLDLVSSLNKDVVGYMTWQTMIDAAKHLSDLEPMCPTCMRNMCVIAMLDPSPHVRELASEMLDATKIELMKLYSEMLAQ
jgi:hypothetical protein